MIYPTEADIGRRVIWKANSPALRAYGFISSLELGYVFVCYGHNPAAKATLAEDLIWDPNDVRTDNRP